MGSVIVALKLYGSIRKFDPPTSVHRWEVIAPFLRPVRCDPSFECFTLSTLFTDVIPVALLLREVGVKVCFICVLV
jgi:hypothetical protein